MRQLRKIDIDYLIIGLSTLVFTSAIILLIKPNLLFKDASNRTSTEQIAFLEEINNDIRIKYSSEINWVPTSKSTGLYNEQMVFSGGESSAQIKFKQGETFNLAPHSMILISQVSENETTLDLKQGSLTGSLSKNISLKLDDKKIISQDNDKSEIKIVKNSKDTIVQLKTGNIQVSDKDGNVKENLDKDSELTIGAKNVTKRKLLHKITGPTNNQKIWIGKDQLITLSWEKIDNKKDLIQISSFSDFKEFKEFSPESNELNININELQCRYCFWRIVRIEDQQIIYSTIPESFQIVDNIAPKIISPQNNSIVTIDLEEQDQTKVMLEWHPYQYTKGFELQISDNYENVKDSKIIEVAQNQLLYELGKKGYFWRIRAKREDSNFTPWSQISSFRVGNFDEVRTVKLKSPDNQHSFTAIDLPYEVNLNWEKIKLEGQYQVQVSNDKLFEENKFKSFLTNETSLKIKLKNPGIYYWKVRFIGSDKSYFPTSQVHSIEIKKYKKLPPIKIELEELNFEVQNTSKKKNLLEFLLDLIISKAYAQEKSFDISWQEVPQVKAYQVELSKDESFSQVVLRKTTKNANFSISNISPGKYFWRVSAIDQNDVVGTPSKSIPLTISFKNIKTLIKEVIKVTKANGNGISIQTLKWSASKYCASYNVKLLRNNEKLIKEANLKTSVWKDEFPVNTKLKWNVSCLDKNKNIINQSDIYKLYFKYPRQFKPPLLISPNDTTFNIFKGDDFQIPFQWEEIEGAKKYRLFVFEEQNLEEPILDQEFDAPSNSVTFNQDVKGNLKWRVQTMGEESFSKPSNVKNFKIYKRDKVSINYLTPTTELITTTRRKPSIKFSWSETNTKYLFVLSSNSDFSKVLFKRIISKNAISIKLPPGNYYWKVSAVVKDEHTNNEYFDLTPDTKSNFLEIHRIEKRFYQISLGGGYINSIQDISDVNSEIFKGKGEFPLLNLELSFADYPILKTWGWLAKLNIKNSQAPIESLDDKQTAIGTFLDYNLQASVNLFRASQYHFYTHLGLFNHNLLYSGSKNNQLELKSIELKFADFGINMFKRFNNIILEMHSAALISGSGSQSNGFQFALSTMYDFESYSLGLNFNHLQTNITADDLKLDESSDSIKSSQFELSLLYRNRF